MTKKILRLASLFATAAAFVLGAMSAHANTLTFQGVTFTTTAVDADTFTLRIQNAVSGGTGDWANIQWLWLLGVKDVGTPSGGSIDGQTVTWSNLELDGNGGCGPGSPPAASCFTWATPLTLTDDFTLTINFTGGPFDFSAPHIKVGFLCSLANTSGTYDVCGNLLSQTIPADSDSDTDTDTDTDVPEPGTLALLGLGLLGIGAARRRRA